MKIRPVSLVLAFALCALSGATVFAADAKKPNILVIWGDDIGIANISAYSDGLMGYETPNIDRIGKEGIRFLQYYGEQSVHRGPVGLPHRAAHHPHRTVQSRFPWCAHGHESAGSFRRRAAQEPRIRHGTIRKESRRRPQ